MSYFFVSRIWWWTDGLNDNLLQYGHELQASTVYVLHKTEGLL